MADNKCSKKRRKPNPVANAARTARNKARRIKTHEARQEKQLRKVRAWAKRKVPSLNVEGKTSSELRTFVRSLGQIGAR